MYRALLLASHSTAYLGTSFILPEGAAWARSLPHHIARFPELRAAPSSAASYAGAPAASRRPAVQAASTAVSADGTVVRLDFAATSVGATSQRVVLVGTAHLSEASTAQVFIFGACMVFYRFGPPFRGLQPLGRLISHCCRMLT